MTAEFRPAVDFAEVAEALDVNTDQICGSTMSDGIITVIYSPNNDDPESVWSCFLRRDSGGILRLQSVPEEMPGFWESVKRQMEG